MRILSVATHDERMYDIFKESCKRNKIHLDILGWGKEWKGFAWRWDLILDHLSTNEIPDKELIIITDAFDSVVCVKASRFEHEFKKFESPMVFSCEPPSNLFFWLAGYYRWRVFGPDPVVNGGSYMGYAGAIKKFIKRFKYKHDTDDHRFLTSLYKHVHLTIDFEGRLFYHHCGWLRTRGRIPNTCLVTFPGSGYTKKILSKLGYSHDTYMLKKESWSQCLEVAVRRGMHYTPFFWREALVLLTLLLGLGMAPLILGIIV